MEKGSNQAGCFIRCLMRELGGKSYNMMFSEGKGVAGGWRILVEKLRQLRARPTKETQREEKLEKPQRGGEVEEVVYKAATQIVEVDTQILCRDP